LTRIRCGQSEKFCVERLSFLSIGSESFSIQCWGASSDRDSKDSDEKEGRKLHLELNPNKSCVGTAIDDIEQLEVVQDTGKRGLALEIRRRTQRGGKKEEKGTALGSLLDVVTVLMKKKVEQMRSHCFRQDPCQCPKFSHLRSGRSFPGHNNQHSTTAAHILYF